MKKSIFIILFLFGITSSGNAQTVTIGSQVWSTKNLDVAVFRNGDPIPEAKTETEWDLASFNGKPAWCYYNNDPANGAKYGRIYNFWAINDERGLAPQGWHVPTDIEWAEAVNSLGGASEALLKMSSGTEWIPKSNNSSGFSAKPGGWRSSIGNFYAEKNSVVYWTSSQCASIIQAIAYTISKEKNTITSSLHGKGYGMYVRCVKGESSAKEDLYACKSVLVSSEVKSSSVNSENTNSINSTPVTFTDSTVEIAGRQWALKNLDVSKFRNGDAIPQCKTPEEWGQASIDKKPAWCYLEFKEENGAKYGKIYNWYAVNDPRGLAPNGWSIPTLTSYESLVKVLGGDSLAHIKLKSESSWVSNGTNEIKFSAMAAGKVSSNGKFFMLNKAMGWWTSSSNTDNSGSYEFCIYEAYISKTAINRGAGNFVKCVRP